jgi:hypothetical protein
MKYSTYILSIFFLLAFAKAYPQQGPHLWQPSSSNMGLSFNRDHGQVLIVTADHMSIWDTAEATLVRSWPMPLSKGQALTAATMEYLSASPDLDQFLYKANGTYQLFNTMTGELDMFPSFDNYRIKEVLGFDYRGWLVIFSEGFHQGFYSFHAEGNTTSSEFLSLEYISYAKVSNDHKYIIFERDKTLRYFDLLTKKQVDLEMELDNWRDDHLPLGMITLYDYDKTKKEGKRIKYRYFLEYGKPLSDKLKGKKAQAAYPEGTPECMIEDYYSIHGYNENSYFILQFNAKENGKMQLALTHMNAADCSVIKKIEFCTSKEQNQGLTTAKNEEATAARNEKKEREEALRPSNFAAYKAKFVKLTNTWVLDYDNIAGVDVSSTEFVQNERYRTAGSSSFAIGRLLECDNGNISLLRMERNKKSGMDRSSFLVYTYDNTGKLLKTEKLGESQVMNGKPSLIFKMAISKNDTSWKVQGNVNNVGASNRDVSFSGSCN